MNGLASWAKSPWVKRGPTKTWVKTWDTGGPEDDLLQQALAALQAQRDAADAAGLAPEVIAAMDAAIARLIDGLSPGAGAAADGRYELANAHMHVELRVDVAGSNIVSGDIFAEAEGVREYLASFRSEPGVALARAAGRLDIVAQGGEALSRGTLDIAPQPGGGVRAELLFFDALPHLGQRHPIALIGRRVSPHLRALGIEVNYERGLKPDIAYKEGERTVTIESCLAAAGLDVSRHGIADQIPPPPGGAWHDGDLHDLMLRYAGETADRSDWSLQLLLLRKSVASTLLGVMFDSGEADANSLPRQGVAVFVDAVSGHPQGDRKLIQTAVHELGHALNLAHRFEREVGRADSTSFMNYDWKYLGGGNESRFWRDFAFGFDADELAFLRHGPWNSVIPGGAEFHTATYWDNTDGGYVPYQPEIPGREFSLAIATPRNGGLFDFAQPVMLSVELTNRTARPVSVPWYLLDPKAGLLEIVIQRRNGRPGGREERAFRPIAHRCFDLSRTADAAALLKPGEKRTNNVNLFFGAGGFAFAEPGEYAVSAVLTLSWRNGRTLTYRSPPCRIRVAYPENRTDERHALDLLRWDVGYYIQMGGSRVLDRARETLESIREERRGEGGQVGDPLAAAITRAFALELARPVPVYADGAHVVKEGDVAKAAALLASISEVGIRAFDPYTAEETLKLQAKLQTTAQQPGRRAPPT